jgi:molecular chaperone IbpA
MNYISNIPEQFLRHAIGFEPLFNFPTQNTNPFPPHNIEKLDDDHYEIVLAVAGYSRDDIAVSVVRGHIEIEGERKKETNAQMIYQGIAFRSFKRVFKLHDEFEVTGCELKDGLLTISVERFVREEDKPKKIAIKS